MIVIGYYNRVDAPDGLARVKAYHAGDTVEIDTYREGRPAGSYAIPKRDAALVGEALRQYNATAPAPAVILRRETID